MSEDTAVSEIERILRSVAFRELALIVEATARVVGAQCFAKEELSRLVSELREVLSNSASQCGIEELPERSGLQWDFASLECSLEAIRRQALAAAEECSECMVPVPNFNPDGPRRERVSGSMRVTNGGVAGEGVCQALGRDYSEEGLRRLIREYLNAEYLKLLKLMDGDFLRLTRGVQKFDRDIFPTGSGGIQESISSNGDD